MLLTRAGAGAFALALALSVVAIAGTAAARPGAAGSRVHALPGYWGSAQSDLGVLDGRPVVAGNWQGPYRPYVLRGDRLVALLDPATPVDPELDLRSPITLSGASVLLAGSRRGRPAQDLFLYELASRRLTNLTGSPDIDEGEACAAPGGRVLAFRAGEAQRFARVQREGTLAPLAQAEVPAFQRCLFSDAHTVLGVERGRSPLRLQRCQLSDGSADCQPSEALAGMEGFVDLMRLEDGRVGLIARRRGDVFRAAWVFDRALAHLAPLPLPGEIRGDVLWSDGAAVRWGLESRFHASVAPDGDSVVSDLAHIGDTWFGVVATPAAGRSLARVRAGRWELIPHPSSQPPQRPAPIRELWIDGDGGERFQAFSFGDSEAKKIVVWWHGGPTENVSPRFSPYFQRLFELGYAVLAVNYPGSTGRGADYEARFRPEDLRACIRAVWRHLARSGAERVVSWSVSSGITPQQLLVADVFPVSAVVDQAGWGRSQIVELTARRGLPLFTIRGRYDEHAPVSRVSFWYEGGHDLTRVEDFAALFASLEPFLAEAVGVHIEVPVGNRPD